MLEEMVSSTILVHNAKVCVYIYMWIYIYYNYNYNIHIYADPSVLQGERVRETTHVGLQHTALVLKPSRWMF